VSNNGYKKMSFDDIIRNKKVLLLGPAPHVLEEKSIEDWRDFDLVVKINKMVENLNFNDDELNYKNDILYHCLDVNPEIGDKQYSIDTWIEKNVGLLRVSPPPFRPYYRQNIIKFLSLNKDRISFSIVDESDYLELFEACQNTIPNTGTFAIFDLLKHNPKELHIRGITFFRGGYSKDYKEMILSEEEIRKSYRFSSHDIDKQILFFKELYKNNEKIIKPDEELLDVIK
jgi:hypothetical protein